MGLAVNCWKRVVYLISVRAMFDVTGEHCSLASKGIMAGNELQSKVIQVSDLNTTSAVVVLFWLVQESTQVWHLSSFLFFCFQYKMVSVQDMAVIAIICLKAEWLWAPLVVSICLCILYAYIQLHFFLAGEKAFPSQNHKYKWNQEWRRYVWEKAN